MDERRQAERGQKKHFALCGVDIVAMDVALDVAGNRMLRPMPVFQCLRIKFEFPRWRGKTGDSVVIDLDPDWRTVLLDYVCDWIDRASLHFFWLENLAVQFVDVVFDQERAVLPHIIQRREAFTGSRLRQTGNTVLKDPPVVFVDSDFLSRPVRRFKVAADAHRSVRIHSPRQFDPEFVFLPNFTQSGFAVRFISEIEFLTLPLQRKTQHRLSETDPTGGMGFLAHQVMTLGSMAHGQNIISKPRSLVRGGSEESVPLNFVLIGQRLDPAKAVRIGPHWVVNTKKI